MNPIATVRKSASPEVRKFAPSSSREIRNADMDRCPPDFRTSGRSAFTILELLLVLVILAVLAGIVGSRFVGQSQSAKIKAARTQLENFNLALNRFEIDMGRYPTSSEGLRVLVEKPGGENAKAWQGPYLDGNAVPKDQWETPWNYRQPGQHRPEGFDLWSNGPDTRDGGGDDVANWTE
jgi:general secretion pathway protein G